MIETRQCDDKSCKFCADLSDDGIGTSEEHFAAGIEKSEATATFAVATVEAT